MNDLNSRYERMMRDLANQENARRAPSFPIINQTRQLTGGPRFEAASHQRRERAWCVVQLVFSIAALVAAIILTVV